MSPAQALADLLTRENAALAALDFAAATALLTAKEAAVAEALAAGALPPDLAPLIAENRRRLEHALQVQRRVLGMMARAVPQAPAQRYGASGSLAAARSAPVLVSARA